MRIQVGATPEIVGRLDLVVKGFENRQNEMIMNIGSDPELDVFMVIFTAFYSVLYDACHKFSLGVWSRNFEQWL